MARKANGQGHTYKVGNSYRTVIRKNGHVITGMASTPQESRRLAKEKLTSLPNIDVSTSKKRERAKLEEYLITWLDNDHQHQIAHSTYKRYRALAIHHVIPTIGSIPLQKITPSDINVMISVMRDAGQSPRSQQQAKALLSVALRDAEGNGYIASNPVLKVRTPINKVREVEPLTIDEVKRLLATYKGTFMSARLHIALLAGLRQGEALGLRWSDIDFDNGTLRVQQQIQKMHGKLALTGLKTERSKRTIALTRESLESLSQHRKFVDEMKLAAGSLWQENSLVFPSSNGAPIQATLDYNEWKRALRLCGIRKRRLHDARHTAATLMYSQGVGIETISRALGHSTSAITSKLYVHSSIEPQMAAAKLINRMISENT